MCVGGSEKYSCTVSLPDSQRGDGWGEEEKGPIPPVSGREDEKRNKRQEVRAG